MTVEMSWSSSTHLPAPYRPPVRNTSNELCPGTPTTRPRPWPSRRSISALHWAWVVPQSPKPKANSPVQYSRVQLSSWANPLPHRSSGGSEPVLDVGAPPHPGGRALGSLGGRPPPDPPPVVGRLGGEQAVEGRAGQIAGIPRVVRADLGVADVGRGRPAGQNSDRDDNQAGAHPRGSLLRQRGRLGAPARGGAPGGCVSRFAAWSG